MRALAVSWFSAVLVSSGLAQDPPAPPGGFPIVELLDLDLAFADGYRTRADLRLPDPSQVTSPTGWPLLMLVPSWGDGRRSLASQATSYAKRGYVTLSWDPRGQGETLALNTWGGVAGPDLVIGDMVELFHWSEAQLGPDMDFTRLAVWGKSFGAMHAWAAAAWSSQPLPQPRGPYTQFPRIAAASPGLLNPDPIGVAMPDRNSFSAKSALNLFVNPARFDAQYLAAAQQAFLQQDFAAWRALIDTPWSQDHELIKSSATAVFARNSWADWWASEIPMVDAMNTMPTGVPRTALISTFEGHGSVTNTLETATWLELEPRWFDHILKGVQDEVSQQPRYRLGTQPDNVEAYLNPATVWRYQQLPSFPQTGLTQPRTYYFRQGGVLSPIAPAGAEPADTVSHAVAAGYGPSQWVQDHTCRSGVRPISKCVVQQVLQNVPLSTVAYVSKPVDSDEELLGRAVATVHVDSPAPNLQIHVAIFDQDELGAWFWVTHGFRAIRGRAPGAASYDVTLGGVSHVFREGHRYVVVVENHLYLRPPNQYHVLTAPFFESYTFDVQHAPGVASRIAVPVRPTPLFSARAAAVTVSQSNGGALGVEIDGSKQRANQLYATLIGISGTVPGFPFLGVTVPMNWDPLTTAGVGPGGSVFQGFVGLLDPIGQARAVFTAAPGLLPPQLIGQRLSFAALSFSAAGTVAASSATQVRIEP